MQRTPSLAPTLAAVLTLAAVAPDARAYRPSPERSYQATARTTLALGTAGYLGCTLALGLLIAASARTQQQAFMGGFFFMMPAILLSGFMTPIEAMPSWLQPITIVNPMRHFVEISRSILLRDASFTDVAPHVAWLYGIAVTLLVTAALRFRRTVA